MKLTTADVSVFTAWTMKGGTLIAQRPHSLLYPLMGILSYDSLVDHFTNTYLQVNTEAGQPGAGIVNETIQFHGAADLI